MAGYSGTPLPRKLGIKQGARVALVRAPDGFDRTIGRLPDGVRIRNEARGTNDVLVFFATRRLELERRFAKLAGRLDADGGLWIAWPKRTSGVATDLSENVVRDIGLASGLVDNKVCAVDDMWSALRFVYRVEDRPRVRGAAHTVASPNGEAGSSRANRARSKTSQDAATAKGSKRTTSEKSTR